MGRLFEQLHQLLAALKEGGGLLLPGSLARDGGDGRVIAGDAVAVHVATSQERGEAGRAERIGVIAAREDT